MGVPSGRGGGPAFGTLNLLKSPVVWASGLVVPLGCGASFVVPFILGFRVSLVVPSFIVGWTSVVFFGLCVGVFASIGLSGCRISQPTPGQYHDEALSVSAETFWVATIRQL